MTVAYHLTILPSGLRVASERLPAVETASIAVTVDVGARHESAADGGLAHLLEHMAFKGTATRSAKDIAEAFDDIGGFLNAHTSLEQTVYYAKVLKDDLPLAVDVLGDILLHSTFDAEELAKERQVILQEIAMAKDTPDDVAFEQFQAACFPDQPLGRSILGEPERVLTFHRDDLKRYMAAHYHPKRIVVSAAGNVDHAALVEQVREHFPLAGQGSALPPEPARYAGGEIRTPRDIEQLHLLMGFCGVSTHDPDYYAAQALAIILGGGMSSRLFQEVREKRGLAYSVSAFHSAYGDTGVFGVYAGVGESQAREATVVICEEIVKMAAGVTDAELRRAQTLQKSSLLMTRESTASVAEWIGRHLLLYGRYIEAPELTRDIETVTAQDLVRVAKKIFSTPLTFAALGPVGSLEPLTKIKDRLFL